MFFFEYFLQHFYELHGKVFLPEVVSGLDDVRMDAMTGKMAKLRLDPHLLNQFCPFFAKKCMRKDEGMVLTLLWQLYWTYFRSLRLSSIVIQKTMFHEKYLMVSKAILNGIRSRVLKGWHKFLKKLMSKYESLLGQRGKQIPEQYCVYWWVVKREKSFYRRSRSYFLRSSSGHVFSFSGNRNNFS